jgi:hypothetical protein
MKKNYILLIFITALTFIFHSPVIAQDDDPAAWKYFKILVMVSDDSLFTKLQDDMHIDPYLYSYTINVDIRCSDSQGKFIVLGIIDDPSSMKFYWSTLRKEVQDGLLNWKKKNKIKLE